MLKYTIQIPGCISAHCNNRICPPPLHPPQPHHHAQQIPLPFLVPLYHQDECERLDVIFHGPDGKYIKTEIISNIQIEMISVPHYRAFTQPQPHSIETLHKKPISACPFSAGIVMRRRGRRTATGVRGRAGGHRFSYKIEVQVTNKPKKFGDPPPWAPSCDYGMHATANKLRRNDPNVRYYF